MEGISQKQEREEPTSIEEMLPIKKSEVYNHCEEVDTKNDLLGRHHVKASDNLYSCEQCDYKSRHLHNIKAHEKARHEGIKFPAKQDMLNSF
jgi:hypothetical protein